MDITTTMRGVLRFAALATTAIGISACSGGGDDGAPTITSFTATPATVAPGGMATLNWAVVDATKITITGGAAPFESTEASGSTSSGVLNTTTTFTLTAENDDGSSTQTVEVTVGAGGPTVDSFTANPTAVAPGGSSVLSWMTTDATNVTITAGGTTIVMDGAADGNFTVMPDAETTYTLIASDADGNTSAPNTVTVDVTVNAPTINSFTATPPTIDAGMATTLNWDVANATSVIVTDDQGAEIYNGADLMSSVSASPAATTTYTLTISDGTNSATGMVTVTVNPTAGASIQSFTASPTLAVEGQNVELAWMVTDADMIEITDGISIAPIHTDTAQAGTFTTQMLNTDITYTLTAFNALGNATETVMVTLSLAAPVVNDFSASPNPGPLNGDTTLSWNVAAATSIDIVDAAGTQSITATTAAAGTIDATLTTATSTFTLTATNMFGSTTATLVVVADSDFPDIPVFAVTPEIGTDPLMATISWEATDVRTLELTANGVPVTINFTPNGSLQDSIDSVMLTLNTSTDFELTATNGRGTDVASTTIIVVPAGSLEVEPNDTATQAESLAGMMITRAGSISPELDADYYSITVPADGFVRARTSDGAGGCGMDTTLTLYDTDGVTQIAFNDDGGDGLCSFLNPATTTELRMLSAGTYYIAVRGFEGTPPRTGNYVLDIEIGTAGCGNGFIEMGESCDDGNTTPGDGCNATCQIEASQTYNAPGTPQTLTTNITNVGDLVIIQVNVASTSYLRAETFEVASTMTCDNANTVMRLLDDTGASIGTDFSDGVGLCSKIDQNDAFARLDAGTYYLTIEESGNDAAIAALELVIEGAAADVCGNGVVEPTVNETCDDGNTMAGDGCSSTCTVESVATYTAPGAPQTFNLDINPIGDIDGVNITVTTDAFVRVQTFEDSVLGTCTVDTVVTLFDSNGVEVLNDDFDGVGSCSLLDPNADVEMLLTAGNYTLTVTEDGNNATIAAYDLVIESYPVGVCGNTVVETGEDCDDGNTNNNDGCSSTCNFGPFNTPAADGNVVFGQIETVGDTDDITINVAAESYLTIETVSPLPLLCNSGDTRIELYDSTGTTLLGDDDLDGIGSCSLINANDAFARVTAGSYVLRIREDGDNAVINIYGVAISSAPVDICGNGVVEATNTENCDDGNTTPGDGCSATCTIEPVGTIALSPGSTQTFTAQALAIGETDYYQVDVAAGDVYLKAETFDDAVAGTCSFDTVLRLYEADGVTQIGTDDDDGVGACSLLDPARDGATVRLATGTYFLRVEEFGLNGAIASYDMVVEGFGVDVCGNGIVEPTNTETCDDGNTTAGDGCDGVCQVETAGTFTVSPGSTQTLTAQSIAANDSDLFTIVVTAEAYVRAETLEDSVAGTCPNEDTVIRLIDSDGVTVLVTDDEGGVDSCSLIDPAIDGQATRLAAGTYFLEVEGFLGAAVATYDLTVDGIAVDVCGNGLTDGANETCDDGNTTAGDGCSATCQIESAGTITLSPGSNQSFTAQSIPAGLPDLYTLTVTAESYIRAETFEDSVAGTCATADTEIRILAADGVTEIVFDDEDGVDNCSLVSPALDQASARLAAGTYFLEVGGRFGVAVANYDLVVDGVAVDVCGNGATDGVAETCDDGNLVDGDGCSAACLFEGITEVEPNDLQTTATPTTLATAGSVLISAAIGAVGDLDFFSFTIPAAGANSVRAETFGVLGNVNTCNGDTRIYLVDSTGTELGNNDDGGFGRCSLVDPAVATYAANLAPGVYYLRLQHWNNTAGNFPYYMSVSLQ